ncbi:MAG TPA: hypothetical protein VG204_12310 [Terriglobia bacterium]|nr:hypothetical protein [Terriglobia bacterium]
MRSKQLKRHTLLFIVLLGLASVPAFAGSAVIGSVAGSMNSTVAGQPVLPNSVVFSGDTLKVNDGATVIALNNGSRLVFGRETEASFLRDSSNVTVLLGQGNVSVFDPDSSAGLQVKASDLSIVPAKGFKTLGEVAMSNGAVTVAVKEGSLRVEGNGAPVEVTKGQVITIHPKTSRAPQAGGAQSMGGSNTDVILDAAGVAAGAIAAILAGIGISRANDAKSAAQAATAAANTANTSAQAATAAANTADADAKAAQATANSVGCALNNFNDNTFGVPSPYTPPSGSSC